MNNITSTALPYTVSADQHIVGTDGFVVPKDFAEFHERFPKFIAGYVRRHNPKTTDADRQDIVLQLKRRLLTVPTSTSEDRIAEFNPERGATAAHFFSNVCMNLV